MAVRARTSASCSSAGFIRSRVEGAGDGQRDDLHGPELGGDRLDGRQRGGLARDDDVARPEQVGLPEPAGRGDPAAELVDLASSRPSTLVMPLGVASDAACIAWPRRRTTSSPASKSIAPAKTRAVYSPRLSPAAPWQASTTSGSLAFRLSRAARLATKIAGWLTSVASSASAGPSMQSCRRSKPRTSPARSNSAADGGQLLVQLPAHPDGLRTLAGEQEGDLGHDRCTSVDSRAPAGRAFGGRSVRSRRSASRRAARRSGSSGDPRPWRGRPAGRS